MERAIKMPSSYLYDQ
ncbi:hypothetical protein [Escherichia coli]